MSWLQLSHVNEMLGGKMSGDDVALERVFTDTRKPDPEGLFFALPGPNFDPHDFLETAADDVAAAFIVNRKIKHKAPQIVVPDTYQALLDLASMWRQSYAGPVVALTGSNGKTTLKEMLYSILSEQGKVLATKGNLNNHIGVPLTLLSLRDEHEFAVIEMGANKPGDISLLTGITKPDIAVITNAAAAHLEGFGSVEKVAASKGEIFEGLDINGLAVINADDNFSDYWQWLARSYRVLTFGESRDASVKIEMHDPIMFRSENELFKVQLALRGKHNVLNASAAIAAAVGFGVPTRAIIRGLEKMQPVSGRLHTRAGPKGSQLIDDSYNANPGSMRAAIEVLASEQGYKILVMGDMAELGEDGERLHREIGRVASEAGIDTLLTLGEMSKATHASFIGDSHHFEEHADLADKLFEYLDGACSVLIKGSRSMTMEKVIDSLAGMQADAAEDQNHAA